MKKLVFGLIATVMFGFVGSAQNEIKLPAELERIITKQLINVNISSEDADILVKKLVLFNNAFVKITNTDYKSLSSEKASNILTYQSSDYFKWSAAFKKTTTIEEIIKTCAELSHQKKSSKEISYYIFTSYSVQILQAYNNSTSITSKKNPCSNIQILEAAGCGCAITGGPWGGIGALCLIAYFGC